MARSGEPGRYVVIHHTCTPRIVDTCDTFREAKEAALKYRAKHHLFAVTINREVW